MKKHTSWKRLGRRTVYSTPHLRVHEDTVELPNGQVLDDYSVIELKDTVSVVATDDEGNVIILEEYRYALDKTMYNIPAGTITRGTEDPQEAAMRELLEETGYTSDDVSLIGTFYEYPTKNTHTITAFRARHAIKTQDVEHEASEQIAVTLMRPEEVKRLVFENKLNSAGMLASVVLGLPELFGKS